MSVLKQKILDRTVTLGVVGLGYVGLPLAVEKAKAGFHVIGFDVQPQKVDMVNAGTATTSAMWWTAIWRSSVDEGMLRATTDFCLRGVMPIACAICVPTPLDEHQQPDISYVQASTEGHGRASAHAVSMVVLESTTYPGTTEELLKPHSGRGRASSAGRTFTWVSLPSAWIQAICVYKTKNTPKVVGAIGEDATEVIAATLYEAVLEGDVTALSSPAVAEMEKILENTYRNVNIGLDQRAGHPVQPHGHRHLGSGGCRQDEALRLPGVLSRAPAWAGTASPWIRTIFSWKAREYGFHTSMIEVVHDDQRPHAGVLRWSGPERVLNESQKAMNGAKVLVLGVAYKQDIDDYRESPAHSRDREPAQARRAGQLL